MKLKAIAGIIMMTLFLMSTLFYAIPSVSADPDTIKIGILGPEGWTVGDGILEGATLAANEINDAGGVLGAHNIQLVWADTLRGRPDPDPETGTLAAEELVAADVDFAIGCFRSESAYGAREVFADNNVIFTITGAATDDLIDDGPGGSTDTLREDYAKWKYVFRNTPTNSSTLVRSLTGLYAYGIKGFIDRVLEDKLVKIYGNIWNNVSHPVYGPYPGPGGPGWPQVNYSVIAEAPVWATGIYNALTTQPTAAYLLGPYANYVYGARVSATATDVSTELGLAVAAGSRLIIHILSGPVGAAFTNQWVTTIPENVRPIIIGINVPGQDQPDHWVATAGNAEYETFTVTAGTRTPINTEGPVTTGDYWDAYVTEFDHAPVYTSYGVYDTVKGYAAAIESHGTWPPAGYDRSAEPPTIGDYDLLIPIIEQTNRHGIVGWFKYTGPHPGPGYEFNATNPGRVGGLHDVWCQDLGTTTTPPGYVRVSIGQWQGPEAVQPEFPTGTPASGRLEIVCPEDQLYSRRYQLPPWFYVLDGVDINYDGAVNILDAIKLAAAFGTSPGDTNWNIEVDVKVNGVINILDAIALAGKFGQKENIPYPG